VPLIFDIKHQPSVPVGQLWVELLRFYALEFNLADLVISIRVKESISRESKDWPKKRIAIEGISRCSIPPNPPPPTFFFFFF
jgi:terminal uridylyltransferase